ncbi:MAG: anaerobic sulfatase maturase [Acidimicrobiales bacterium]|jgi:uncharacterized protein|nr:anaerobic sulfatase maturase [Acidimicrobiales bacterium]
MSETPVALGRTRAAVDPAGPTSPEPSSPAAPTAPTARRSFHVLAKPTGPICNLDCEYCFFLSKEALYPGDRFRMSDELLDTYVRQLLDGQPDGIVSVAWQGGEPTLMGVDFFRRAVALVEQHRRPTQQVEHTIQTNGTLLTDEWCELLAEHRFLVGLSIDGPPELHDVYRVDKRGAPTSAKVLRGLELLKAHGVDVNVLCTVNAANQDHPVEVYRYVRDVLGVQHLQLIPIVERDNDTGFQEGDTVTERSVDPEKWGAFLVAVFDEWVVRDVGTVFVQMFDAALAAWLDLPSSMCIFRETCGDALALEHNGDLYSCDHFVEPEHLLGNITTTTMVELVSSPKQRAFGRAKADTLPAYCRECEVRFACHGECPKNRFTRTPDGEDGLNYLCAGYRHFFNHVDGPMRIMADLLREGRHADEIVGILRSAGRNDPCPCGSGRKAKLCHQR